MLYQIIHNAVVSGTKYSNAIPTTSVTFPIPVSPVSHPYLLLSCVNKFASHCLKMEFSKCRSMRVDL